MDEGAKNELAEVWEGRDVREAIESGNPKANIALLLTDCTDKNKIIKGTFAFIEAHIVVEEKKVPEQEKVALTRNTSQKQLKTKGQRQRSQSPNKPEIQS